MIEKNGKVMIWENDVEIPTYPVGKPDKNPMFLEKRVYQGSSGKVYPLPVIDKIYDEKVMKKYHIIFLENDYLQIWIMPELGGRIQRALDKTNNYDFVYYNQVIKPALVGLAGPWLSGGIEFNWPQHHRPNTFGPVEYTLKDNEDGSKTVWVSEIDIMYRTKVTTGFTLHPDKAYLQIDSQLYNGTCEPQTFLWWANPAVAVNDHTQSVFPPDVYAVLDHGKRDVSKFPIATGTYYKVDYSSGVDISRYKNIPVPTSYMAYYSEFNFVGGYDHQKQAGLLHVANHHVSPGKKQWTWGNGDFGQAWDRNLTDDDGPYIELMTGVFTDNQPDFTWLNPYEEKTFTQYFMPYKDLGVIKNATIDAAVNLEISDGFAFVLVYATSVLENAEIELKGKNNVYLKKRVKISPIDTFKDKIKLESNEIDTDLLLTVRDQNCRELVSYKPLEKKHEKIPEAAKPIPAPEQVDNNEALFLAGMHLEQYRHATYESAGYYLEGLKRDPNDIRINNAYGKLLFRWGQFEKSEKYFRTAVKTSSKHNTNLYDGEPLFNLGLSLKMQGRLKEAYDSFYKSCWSVAMQDSGYFSIARIDAINGEFKLGLEHIEKSIIRNYHNYKARNLKTALLRKVNDYVKAEKLAKETVELDILDFGARNELYLIALETGDAENAGRLLNELNEIMRDDSKNYIEMSIDYAEAGMHSEAIDFLRRLENMNCKNLNPMVYYYLGWFCLKTGDIKKAEEYYAKGGQASSDYCFPNRLEDILVLQSVTRLKNEDAKAFYYLGNLWYDRKQFDEALECWVMSAKLDEGFPTVHRNLALAFFNKFNDPKRARQALEKAFKLNTEDARVFLELDQLYKKLGVSPKERLENFRNNMKLVDLRDDLYVEYITLLNIEGECESAKELILVRQFHPWEGGEGKITTQYVHSNIEIGKKYLAQNKYNEALQVLLESLTYPHNLGEGKLFGSQENNKNYFIGCAYEGLGKLEDAREYLLKASVGLDEPTSAMFYNDQPPEMIFYQGMALLKLGEQTKAKGKFNKLVEYGEKHLFDIVTIDYFAVSLPDFLIFEEDLNRKNLIHCHYLIGLGYLGMGKLENAKHELKKVIDLEASHLGTITHIKMI